MTNLISLLFVLLIPITGVESKECKQQKGSYSIKTDDKEMDMEGTKPYDCLETFLVFIEEYKKEPFKLNSNVSCSTFEMSKTFGKTLTISHVLYFKGEDSFKGRVKFFSKVGKDACSFAFDAKYTLIK